MSFSDLMSSSRGPGVVGMLLAMVVLIGFGLLFLFAFDERFQGKELTIEAEIEQLFKEAQHLSDYKAGLEQQLSNQPRLAQSVRELNAAKRENQFRDAGISGLSQRIQSFNEAIAAKNREVSAYKDEYRAFVRGKAKGTTYESLKTRNGEVYQQVEVREVTAVGMQIIHEGGHKRVAFEDLPPEIQDYYQFDSTQKQAALSQEAAQRQQHDAATAAADAAAAGALKAQRQKEEQTLRQRSVQAAQAAQVRIRQLEEEIRALQIDIEQESKKPLSRAPQLRQQLSAKEQEKSSLSLKLAELKSQGF